MERLLESPLEGNSFLQTYTEFLCFARRACKEFRATSLFAVRCMRRHVIATIVQRAVPLRMWHATIHLRWILWVLQLYRRTGASFALGVAAFKSSNSSPATSSACRPSH